MRNLMRAAALIATLAAPASSAFAGTVFVARPPVVRIAPRISVATPTVHLSFGFDPWSPRAVAIARPGFVWIPGHFDAYGGWTPGFYRPIEARPGMVFEPGYWVAGTYHEGYWRPAYAQHQRWVPGHYNARRGWVAGHWSR
ncbi:MAG: hypothetical protein ABMA64_08135 [Myxococcota bacterium]